jgi:hypothetical protein
MKTKIAIYIIIVFSVVVMYFNNGHGQSVLMHFIMYLSPFLLILGNNFFKRKNLLPICLMISIAFTGVVHSEVFRFSTVIYSMMFILTFVYFQSLVDASALSIDQLCKLTRLIIKLYAIVLLFQHLGVLFNLPILNENPGIIYDTFKTNSLSNEASHTGPIVTILMFTYIKLLELKLGGGKLSYQILYKHDKWIIIYYLYIVLGSLSVTCLFALVVLSLYFINKKHFIIGLATFTLLLILIIFSDSELGERIRVLLPAVAGLDPRSIYLIDPSSSARIGPILVYFNEFNILDFNTWFGFGCDYATRHVMYVMTGSDVSDDFGEIGGIINFMYNYGFIASMLYFCMIIKITKIKSFLFLLYITLFIVSPFNVHMTWLFLMLSYLIRYFEKNKLIYA